MLRRCRTCMIIALSAAAIRLSGGEANSSSSSSPSTGATVTVTESGSAVETVTSSGEEYSECRTGLPRFLSDGDCDPSTNTMECSFDGGDCCPCTCVDGPTYTCGHTGFDCLDPDASCTDDEDSSCVEWEKGDSFCDEYNNKEHCSWDGGDCCECTCNDTEDNTCADNDFNCLDPNAECFSDDEEGGVTDDDAGITDDDATSASAESTCVTSKIGDGFCNYINNIEECQYDGGDCCSCTCVESTYSCASERFKCVNPDAECTDEDDDGWPAQVEAEASSGVSTATSSEPDVGATNDSISDDDILAGREIGNDSIATDWGSDDAGVYDEHDQSFQFSHCFFDEVGDGACNADNNIEDCNYDGGDCCYCTCVDVPPSTCGSPVAFNCEDPSVSESCSQITSPTSRTSDDSSSSKGLFVGAIAGAALISVIILGVTVCCYKRARRKRLNIAAGDASSAPVAAPTIDSPKRVPTISNPREVERMSGISPTDNERHAVLV